MNPLERAKVYRFLAEAFLYPTEVWPDDLPLLADILAGMGWGDPDALPIPARDLTLDRLQAEHRRTFGTAGSLVYETECGLPNEFQQSQEMADIAGFYRAFGLMLGGAVRERPDHIAVELEFMHVLALKEAFALERGLAEQKEICIDAQGAFLRDHLAGWTGLLAEAVAKLGSLLPEAPGPESLYPRLARLAHQFVLADAERLGMAPEAKAVAGLRPTPPAPDLSCDGCPVAG